VNEASDEAATHDVRDGRGKIIVSRAYGRLEPSGAPASSPTCASATDSRGLRA